MNTAWIDEYLSDEWSEWDYSTFKKYQLTEKEIFFGWWISGDIQSCSEVINKIFKLINQSKHGHQGEFLGNSYVVLFSPKQVIIKKPISNRQQEYTIEEFEHAVLEWEYKLNQMKD